MLALKYGAGATHRAIADVTGLSESNVGTITSPSRKRITLEMVTGGYTPVSVPSAAMVWWAAGFALAALWLAVRRFETRPL